MAEKMLDPHFWTLESMFKYIYNVPVYQRPYSWDKEQVEVLLKDIIEAYKSDSKYDGYYTGNIIIYNKSKEINGLIEIYDIIDGQQRITTFALILLALYALSMSMKIADSEETVIFIKKALWKYVEREYKKDLKAVNLNSIEKDCFSDLYDYCFDNPAKAYEYYSSYTYTNNFDKRIVENFKLIYGTLKEEFPSQNDILNFTDYILQYIKFIVIEATCKENKVFSMFESINSKGKKLEEIDLIKTYIFSKLDASSHDTYLKKWGELIIKTEDQLYDYLYNYIKAYLCFYRNNINVSNFKFICSGELLKYFHESDEAEALKKLLDDMSQKVQYYNMLSSTEKAYGLMQNNKFRFYYELFTRISYKHPKALFMRTFAEYDSGNLDKNDAVEIIVQTISFMVKFLSICGRDSKDSITMFSGIMKDIYERNAISKDMVNKAIAIELIKQGITPNKIKDDLKTIDAYEKNRNVTAALLALYDSTEIDSSNKIKASYDKAYTLLHCFGPTFSLDHLLVQTPKSDSKFSYYKDNESNTLVLKPGNDFPSEYICTGMDYDLFTQNVLNRIGNLRLCYKDKNSQRQNSELTLDNSDNFINYSDMKKRSQELIDILVDYCLPTPNIDISKLQLSSIKKSEAELPKMNKLIEFNLVKPGDHLYITTDPKNSEAELLDEKFVLFQGEKITLNDWGCKVTGWKSIRIYAYTAIVGEEETLHSKRMKLIEENNEVAN